MFARLNTSERTRLLTGHLWHSYATLPQEPLGENICENYHAAHRWLLEHAPTHLRRHTIELYINLIRRSSERMASAYEKLFFQANDLKYAAKAERELVKQRLIRQIGTDGDARMLNTVAGVGAYLTEDEAAIFARTMMGRAVGGA